MPLFIIVFITIYALAHVVVFRGLSPLLRELPAARFGLALWMAAMIGAPIAVRLLDAAGKIGPARLLAHAGYGWMGFLFLAFSIFFLLLGAEIVLLAISLLFPAARAVTLNSPAIALPVLLISIAASLYALWEATSIRVEQVAISSEKSGCGISRLRIAQISDLHLGLILRERRSAEIIELLEELRPDLVVATGDVVDAQIDHLDGLGARWRQLAPPLGKYAVTGNHEAYAGLGQSLSFLRNAGFTVLRGRALTIADAVRLIGVDDPHAVASPPDEQLLLSGDSSLYTILLKHRPDVSPAAEELVDLQLSGHTHGGQIFPFSLLTGLRFPRQRGAFSLHGGGVLYVSRGTGTWGPPMRLFSPPEITLFDITLSGPDPSPRPSPEG